MQIIHSDAEGAIGFSAAYRGTPESQNTAKKPNKTQKSAEKLGRFRHMKNKNHVLSWILFLSIKEAFLLH